MPTATTFQAKGRRNGFPYCLEKKDVSEYAFVEPLTLDEAMNIWWNIYSLSGSATSDDFAQESPIPKLEEDDFEKPAAPINRSCNLSLTKSESTSQTRIKISTSTVVKMYNGDKNDENNFIGYGIGSSDAISEEHSMVFLKANSFFGLSELGIQSFQKIDNSGDSGLLGTIKYSTVTLANLPFVQYERQKGTGSSVSLSSVELYTY
tara:strand:+ start:16 stop:633 length:618 start_codon:yes stop_codon:yes gene_type:complete